MKIVNPTDELLKVIKKHGSQTAAAKALGISDAYLSDMANGRRDLSDAMLEKLGMKRVVIK